MARTARVSAMTVSNVINGKFDGMTEQTRKLIEQAIAELGYRPDLVARGLRKGQRFSVGMLIVDRSPRFLADPWITNLVAGVSNYLNERNYSVLLHGAEAAKVSKISMLRNVVTDGLLVLLSGPVEERNEVLSHLQGLRQPIILFQGGVSKALEDVCIVRQDDFGGAFALTEMLLAHALRRIITLTSDWPWPALEERERGIRKAIEQSGRSLEQDVVKCPENDFRAIGEALKTYVDEKGFPDLILAANDQMGIAAMQHIRRLGANIPQDVMVTGFNAFDFWQYSETPLTTVRSPAYRVGGDGAAKLLERLQTGKFEQGEFVLPVEIQLGETTRPVSRQSSGRS
ncbi:MAG: LacI family DNA-binding transcriptional regulator [Parvibaculaceae bacterium]